MDLERMSPSNDGREACYTADALANFYLPPDVPTRSVFALSINEINVHKWIVSKCAGYDKGQEAVSEWIYKYWHKFLCSRWIEHLQGVAYWIELDRNSWGNLKEAFPNDRELLGQILEILKQGKDDLGVIRWTNENNVTVPKDKVHEILALISIKSCRLRHQFEARQAKPNF